MRIVIGSDHAGFHLKATIIDHVTSLGQRCTTQAHTMRTP